MSAWKLGKKLLQAALMRFFLALRAAGRYLFTKWESADALPKKKEHLP